MSRITVLIELDSDDALRASEKKAATGAPAFTTGEQPTGLPDFITLDASYHAVPIGQGDTPDLRMRSMIAGDSARHIVRGTIDAADIDRVKEPVDGARVFADAAIGAFPICPGEPPMGTATDVRGLLKVSALSDAGLDGRNVALAIVDTGINLDHLRSVGMAPKLDQHLFWTNTPQTLAGQYPTDHGTMCSFAAMIVASNVTLLDFPILHAPSSGGSVMDGVLSDALQAYNVMLTMMSKSADVRPYDALVVNNSWGMFHPSWDFPPGHPGRYADNPNHPFNLIVGSLVQAGADVLFAAGNCGSDCPDGRCQNLTTGQLTGANSHPDVISVAGVDTSDTRVGYSTQGPGALANNKPDLAAYTHFLGSRVYGVDAPDGGTSTACPVAAGCIAALRTNYRHGVTSTADMAEVLRKTARKPGGGSGWDADVGFGIINPLAANSLLQP